MPKHFSQLTGTLQQFGLNFKLSARLNTQNATSYISFRKQAA